MEPPPAATRPEAEWEAVLSEFGLGQLAAAPEGVVGGWSHHVWKVSTEGGAFAVKEMTEEPADTWWPERSDVAAALELAAWRGGEIPMAEPIAARSGALTARLRTAAGPRTYRCHRWVEGRRCLDLAPSPEHAASVGRSVATIAALGLPAGTTEDQLPWEGLDVYGATREFAEAEGVSWAGTFGGLQELVDGVRAVFTDLRGRGIPMQVLHRDIDPKNAAVVADGTVALFDWDYAGPRLPGAEFLDAALSFSGGDVDADPACVWAFADAYVERAGVLPSLDGAPEVLLEQTLRWIVLNARRALRVSGSAPERLARAVSVVTSLAPSMCAASKVIHGWARRLAEGDRSDK